MNAIGLPEKGIRLTSKNAQQCISLYYEALMKEEELDNQIANFYSLKKEDGKKHGYYIRKFFMNTLPGVMKLGDKDLEKYGEELFNGIREEIGDKLFEGFGLSNLEKDFLMNMQNKNMSYGFGNILEGYIFKGIYDSLANSDLEKKFSFKMKDTSPRNFGSSIKYDIMLQIAPKDMDGDLKSKVNLPIEVKSGVKEDYKKSNFHFGDFSDTSLSFKDNRDVYKELINNLQESFNHYLYKIFINEGMMIDDTGVEIEGQKIEKSINDLMIDIGIQYIKWRLHNNYLVFVGNGKDKVNLASEIIEGLFTEPGGYLYFTLKDLFEFVTLTKNNRYHINVLENSKYLVNYDTELKNWIPKAEYQVDSSIKQVFNQSIIMPKFNASLWYGKRK